MATTLQDRLKARTRQLGMNAADVASLAGVNRSFIYDILRGRSLNPKRESLEQIANVLKVDREWLSEGVGHVEGGAPLGDMSADDFISIAYANAHPSMGGGSILENDDKPGRNFHFRRSWIKNRLNASPSTLRVLQVEGDSMRPTLEDGDTVLVDMNLKSPMPPGIFVLHDGMGLVAKRLEHIPNSDPPAVQVISDNSLYSPYERTFDEINIVGRIRWFGREM